MALRATLMILIFSFLTGLAVAGERGTMILGEPRVIWRQAGKNEATGLVKHRGRVICVLKSKAGLELIGSAEDGRWRLLSQIAPVDQVRSYRDVALTVTSDGRLMLNAVVPEPQGGGISKVWFSYNGVDWTAPVTAAENDYFVSEVTWHVGVAYNLQRGSCCGNHSVLRLGISHDHGETFQTQTEDLSFSARGKAAMVFSQDDAFCITKRGETRSAKHGVIGTSVAPFWDWNWKKMDEVIDPPSALRAPNGSLLVAGGRLNEQDVMELVIKKLDPKTLELESGLKIPRKTAAPGFVSLIRDGREVLVCFNDWTGDGSTVSLASLRWE